MDKSVTLICEENSEEINLGISFSGIFEFGNDGSEPNVATDISVEDIDISIIKGVIYCFSAPFTVFVYQPL